MKGSEVLFSDGSRSHFDHLLIATGYRVSSEIWGWQFCLKHVVGVRFFVMGIFCWWKFYRKWWAYQVLDHTSGTCSSSCYCFLLVVVFFWLLLLLLLLLLLVASCCWLLVPPLLPTPSTSWEVEPLTILTATRFRTSVSLHGNPRDAAIADGGSTATINLGTWRVASKGSQDGLRSMVCYRANTGGRGCNCDGRKG